MSVVVERAGALFKEGFSCSQAVAAVFGPRYGLDEAAVLKVSACFGGGMQAAEVCGAVSGAVMVIGMKDGYADPKDKAAKFHALGRTAEFMRLFRERHGRLTCRELLGCDIMTPEGKQKALDAKLFATACPDFVAGAARILEEMGY